MAATGYQRFFAELKRRKVFRVAAVYGAVAFVILQVADILVPALHLPESFTTGFALLSILGFPIALVLAWAFDSTPSGIQRTDAAKTGEIEAIIAQPVASRWPSGLLALVGIVALAIGGWLALSSRSAADSTGAVSTSEVRGDRAAMEADPGGAESPPRTAVAVLPFQSLTDDEESREFALGIHDDLLTQLTRIDDLRVTSRTSVMTYADSDKPAGEIARELGVGSLVEGGVRSSGGRVRVNVQLIDASTDEHLWAETYDRELTVENVFAIQGEIAVAVTEALEAELSAQEAADLAELPTSSTEAWAAYHRGRRLLHMIGDSAAEVRMLAEFQRAVDLDPEFAAAWAMLVRSQAWKIRRGFESDTMPARRSLDRLLDLAPDAPDTRLATGYYRYYGHADFDGALPEFQAYRSQRPGDGVGWQAEGWVLRRVGRWEESTVAQRHGVELDPLNTDGLWNLAINYRRLRQYTEASRYFQAAAELSPDNTGLQIQWLQSELLGAGDMESARRIAAEVRGLSPSDAGPAATFWVAAFERDYEAGVAAIRGHEPGEWTGFPAAGDYGIGGPPSLLRALVARMEGNDAESSAWADSLVVEARTEVESRPIPEGGDRFAVAAIARSLLALGLALRGESGDMEEALRTADESVRLYGMHRDDVDGNSVESLRMWTLIVAGEKERALDVIGEFLSRPANLGPGDLKLNPMYDSLRGDPRFEELLARAEALVQN